MIGRLADGADHGEGGVQNERSVIGPHNELVGGAHLDGAVVPESAAHARPAQKCHQQQRERLHGIVAAEGGRSPLSGRRAHARHSIPTPQKGHEQHEEHHQVPVVDKLQQHNAAQLVVAAKLAEEGGGGAPRRVLEIDRVAQVHGKGHGVDHNKHPLAQLLPRGAFLCVERQKHQQQIEGVGVGDGRRVEIDASPEKGPQPARPRQVGIGVGVLEEESQPSDHVGCVEQQQVDCHGAQRRKCFRLLTMNLEHSLSFDFRFFSGVRVSYGRSLSCVMRIMYCWMMAFSSRSICGCWGERPLRLRFMSESLSA